MYAESNTSQNSNFAWHSAQDTGTREGVSRRPALHCANCDIEFLWPPTIVQDKTFCCTGCAAGGPCNCDYSQYNSVNISGVIHYTLDH